MQAILTLFDRAGCYEHSEISMKEKTMLELQTYIPAFGSPSASPFGAKAIALLNMAGAKYTIKFGADPRKAPKQKLPVLIDGDQTIADSDFIRAHLEKTHNIDFDAGLSKPERATSRALIRMVEEHLYFALVCDRWLNDDNWEHVRATFFGKIPALVRGVITNRIRKYARAQATAQGMARHSVDEQLARADKDITAITDFLGDKPFLFGKNPTAADASVIPMLKAIAGSPMPTKLSTRVNNDVVLAAYLERGCAALFPAA